MQKLLIALIVAAAIAGTALYTLKSANSIPAEAFDAWTMWKNAHGKTFASPAEEARVQGVWYENFLEINEHNKNNAATYSMAMNHLMDLTKAEFAKIYLTLKVDETRVRNEISLRNVANDIDWRSKGAVSGVKNQGSCGSCWAFSTVGALEGLNEIRTGSMKLFSEQQLVDCAGSYGNYGCNGGLMDNAFKYVRDHGITTESAYPYTARDGSCKTNSGSYRISGYTDVSRTTSGLKAAITRQPVSVAVDASNFQFYGGGVFSNCRTSLNHGVTAVGYTSSYWTIKNSWGSGWGEQGYIRLATGNTCGVQSSASYPNA